ncbi:protease inhibitor I42 family protein [Arthrobacter sp. HLT1-20]
MITVRAGELFSVEFPATPATGYQWQVAEVPAGLELVDSSFAPDAPAGVLAPVPSPGTQKFHFMAGEPGRQELLFVLKRSWESQSLQERSETVDVLP